MAVVRSSIRQPTLFILSLAVIFCSISLFKHHTSEYLNFSHVGQWLFLAIVLTTQPLVVD